MCDNHVVRNDYESCILCDEERDTDSKMCAAHKSCASCGTEWSEREVADSHSTPDGFVCDECYNDHGACSFCSGSGEGMYDGSTCYFCKGSGESSSYADSDYDKSYEPDHYEYDFEWGY